ncbi:MAG: hypothetical protein V4706_14855 [Pseudomonadota bacterium]
MKGEQSMRERKSLIEKIAIGVTPAVDLGASALGIIPWFGPVLGMVQALSDIQSQILVNKMQAFLAGTANATQDDLNAASMDFDTPGKREDITGSLLLAINSYTDLYNCQLLGKLYLAFLRKEISGTELRRFALAINIAFSDDIQEFLIDKCLDVEPQAYKENLQRTGLIRQITGDDAPAWGVAYEVSPFGRTFLRVMSAE